MATATTDHWTARIFSQEARDCVAYAAQHGVTVLPITISVDGAPVIFYGVYRRGHLVARCTLYEDAAEVAAALAVSYQLVRRG